MIEDPDGRRVEQTVGYKDGHQSAEITVLMSSDCRQFTQEKSA